MSSYENQIHQKISELFNIKIQSKLSDEQDLLNIASCLFPYVLKKSKKKINPKKKWKIELIKSPVINGYVDINSFHICVCSGMIDFIHHIVKLFLYLMSVRDDEQVVEETQISTKETVIIAENLIQGFWKNELWKTSSIELIRFNKGQIELASHLFFYAQCFVLAHEFGHAIIKICPKVAKKELYISSDASIERSKTLLASLNINEKDKMLALEKWPEELAADMIGLDLCLGLGDNEIGRSVICASAELVFIAKLMLQKYREFEIKKDYWVTKYQDERDIRKMDHPPTEWRREFIHAYADSLNHERDISGLGVAFKQLSDYFLDQLCAKKQ